MSGIARYFCSVTGLDLFSHRRSSLCSPRYLSISSRSSVPTIIRESHHVINIFTQFPPDCWELPGYPTSSEVLKLQSSKRPGRRHLKWFSRVARGFHAGLLVDVWSGSFLPLPRQQQHFPSHNSLRCDCPRLSFYGRHHEPWLSLPCSSVSIWAGTRPCTRRPVTAHSSTPGRRAYLEKLKKWSMKRPKNPLLPLRPLLLPQLPPLPLLLLPLLLRLPLLLPPYLNKNFIICEKGHR